MSIRPPLSYDEARVKAHGIAQARRQAREDLQEALVKKAEAQHEYRKSRAVAWAKVEGRTAEERKVMVEASTAEAEFAVNMADAEVRIVGERLAEIDAERSSLHRLIDWAQRAPAGEEG